MKKLVLSAAAVLLGLSAIGLSQSRAIETGADDVDSSVVESLIDSYVGDGRYTKKSAIYLNEATRTEEEILFHGRHNVLERTTYYDERPAVNALLMGNYDGSFGDGTTGLNSGYIADGTSMKHFFYDGYADPSVDDFFDSEHITPTYTVKNTSPNDYFVNLSKLADVAATIGWTTDGQGTYYHNPDISMETVDPDTHVGKYNSEALQSFVYFAAPMLLENNFFSIDFIQVKASYSYLSIRIYVTSSDSAKVTVYGGGRYLLSEARIYTGISLNPGYRWYLHGDTYSWVDDDEPDFEYMADAWEIEQYKLVVTLGYNAQFGIKNTNGAWYAFSNLENTTWFLNWGGNIVTAAYSQEYTIFMKPNASSIYIAYDTRTINAVLCDAWLADNPTPRVHVWHNEWDSTQEKDVAYNFDTWAGIAMGGSDKNYSLAIPSSATHIIVVRGDPSSSSTAWNQTGDIWINDTAYGNAITVTFTSATDYTVA